MIYRKVFMCLKRVVKCDSLKQETVKHWLNYYVFSLLLFSLLNMKKFKSRTGLVELADKSVSKKSI